MKIKREGERGVAYNLFIRAILIVLSITAALNLLRFAVSEYLTASIPGSSDKVALASRVTYEDAGYRYMSGIMSYNLHEKADIRKAIENYRLSLKRNPADAQVWLAAAKAYRDMGMMKEAEYAIRKSIRLDKHNPGLIWESGVFFLLDNKPTDAVRSFKRYIFMIPAEQENVYSLCHMMGLDSRYILDNLIPQDYNFLKRYFNFIISSGLLKESHEAWERLKAFGPGRTEYLTYTNFLIGHGELREALEVWGNFAKRFDITGNKPSGNIIWNGNFDLPIENSGFDWRIGQSDGVRIFVDSDIKWAGSPTLNVSFDGNSNPGIHIAEQIVPVEPKRKYKFSGYIKTEQITTQNGILFEVSNYFCDPLVKKTEPMTGSNLWKKMDLEFETPKSCKAVRIAVKREQSGKFDNKISGDAWIGSLTMTARNN